MYSECADIREEKKKNFYRNLVEKCCRNFPRKLSSLSRSPFERDSPLPPKTLGYLFLRDHLPCHQATRRDRLCRSPRSKSDLGERIMQDGHQLLRQRKAAGHCLGACRSDLVDFKLRILGKKRR